MAIKSPLRGKVAGILNEREVVINLGELAGIKDGMQFRVIQEIADIKDPDTQESLGPLTREKMRVRIVQIQPDMSVGGTYETYTTQGSGLLSSYLWLLHESEQRVRTLRLGNQPSSCPALEEGESFFEVGDLVEQILE